MKAIMTVGISASGKTKFAKELVGFKIIERDMIRAQILNELTSGETEGKVVWSRWKWKWEGTVTRIQREMIQEAAEAGENIIISDTNLSPTHRLELSNFLQRLGYDVEYKFIQPNFEQAVKYDTARENGVGISVLAEQLNKWNSQFKDQYKGTPNTHSAVIVDIDGTLAHMDGRSPFEWTRVGEDSVDLEVKGIVDGLRSIGYKIIVVSGRDGVCKDLTAEWLKFHGIQYDDFFIRPEGDTRPDTEIKEEIFWNDIAPYYNIRMAIDDRPKVCMMWRSIGVKVIQVGNPYIFF